MRVIKGLRVNLGEIKDDTPVAGWAEAPEMITNQNFLRIIARDRGLLLGSLG